MQTYFYASRRLLSIRLGNFCLVVKPTADELFSQRNGYWSAIRLHRIGLSILWQKVSK